MLTALAASLLPAGARAQGVAQHESEYTTPVGSPAAVSRSAMPLISPDVLPTALFLRRTARARATGGVAAIAGRVDGTPSTPLARRGGRPQAFGTQSELAVAPYTVSRASADKLGVPPPTDAASVGVTSYPWRATGKLYFRIHGEAYVCTASLIGPGLLVTAAHCVFDYGKIAVGWHTDFLFAPAQYENGRPPPYGTWTARTEIVPAPYRFGTDTCVVRGVVCNNDIAVIVMARNAAGQLPGTVVGWYGYGWGGYSFVSSFGGALLASITQLGYPVAFDDGMMLERNDGVGGLWTSGALQNVVLGSALTGGSSGGPWLVNFGAVPSIDASQANLGTSSTPDVVVGVTSWGYNSVGANTQGASWFGPNVEYPASAYLDLHGANRGAGNIGAIVRAACNIHPEAC